MSEIEVLKVSAPIFDINIYTQRTDFKFFALSTNLFGYCRYLSQISKANNTEFTPITTPICFPTSITPRSITPTSITSLQPTPI